MLISQSACKILWKTLLEEKKSLLLGTLINNLLLSRKSETLLWLIRISRKISEKCFPLLWALRVLEFWKLWELFWWKTENVVENIKSFTKFSEHVPESFLNKIKHFSLKNIRRLLDHYNAAWMLEEIALTYIFWLLKKNTSGLI